MALAEHMTETAFAAAGTMVEHARAVAESMADLADLADEMADAALAKTG